MTKTKRRKTKNELRIEELEHQVAELQTVLHNTTLEKAYLAKSMTGKDTTIKSLTSSAEEFKKAAENANLKLNGTLREMKILMERKQVWDAERVAACEQRDDLFSKLKDAERRIFELETGIADQIAAAEGKALFYKDKLVQFLTSLKEFAQQAKVDV